MRLPLCFSQEHTLMLSRNGSLEQQLEERLQELVFSSDSTWCAFYLQPAKEVLTEPEASRLHVRLTELLLHRGVLVQEIAAALPIEDLADPARLPAADLTLRMGGIPWRPQGNNLTDPVVAFAIHHHPHPGGPETGAAVFFAPGGRFAGARAFNPAHPLEWGGLSMEFFTLWEQEGESAQRLVLHLPRMLKEHELQALQTMVEETRPGLQVVLMVIRRSRPRDVGVFRCDGPDTAVPDGTWVFCSNSDYLLFTAGAPGTNKDRAAPVIPLQVRFLLLNGDSSTLGALAPALLDQLHCLTRLHRPARASRHKPANLACAALLARRLPLLRNKVLPAYGKELPWFV